MSDNLAFLNSSADSVAPLLLGCILERQIDDKVIRAKIVETEAYESTDAASHSFKPKTERTSVMFDRYGQLYVYFTYGMHYCMNIVVGPAGHGAAVLIRAAEPLDQASYDILSQNRHGQTGVNMTNGPAKLCQALNINKTLNGHDLREAPLKLLPQPALGPNEIQQTNRIGISRARSLKWRFYIKHSPYISKS